MRPIVFGGTGRLLAKHAWVAEHRSGHAHVVTNPDS
jgi:hypothetical protein